MEQAEQAVAELALAAASRMLRERIEADDPVALRALAEVRASLELPRSLVVRVDPRDVEALKKYLKDEREIELLADPDVARGGCIVETSTTIVDAGVEAAIDGQREALSIEPCSRSATSSSASTTP